MKRKRNKEIADVIEEFTSNYEIEHTGGGHLCVTLRRNGHTRKVFTGNTPSDHRSLRRFRTDARRMWMELLVETSP